MRDIKTRHSMLMFKITAFFFFSAVEAQLCRKGLNVRWEKCTTTKRIKDSKVKAFLNLSFTASEREIGIGIRLSKVQRAHHRSLASFLAVYHHMFAVTCNGSVKCCTRHSCIMKSEWERTQSHRLQTLHPSLAADAQARRGLLGCDKEDTSVTQRLAVPARAQRLTRGHSGLYKRRPINPDSPFPRAGVEKCRIFFQVSANYLFICTMPVSMVA